MTKRLNSQMIMADNICEEKKFESVFRAQAESLRNFFYYRAGNLQQAEDLVQEAFGRLWENCAKVKPEKARSFLYKVANNLFLNEVRHQKVKLKFQNEKPSQQSNETPQFILETKEFQEKLSRAIAELPEKQRLVFLMNRLDKKTYQEIADTLEISVKAVEKRMHKALSKLREIYQKV